MNVFDAAWSIKRLSLLTSSSQAGMSSKAKLPVKYKKAPQAPRRFKSAYMFYSTWKHKDIREHLAAHEVRTMVVDAEISVHEWFHIPHGSLTHLH